MRVPLVVATLLVLWVSIPQAVLGHSCIHDSIVDKQRRERATAGFDQTYPTTDLPQASNTQPMRIYIDQSFLDGDNAYTCHTVGQVVRDIIRSVDYTCLATDILGTTKRNYLLNTLVPEAVNLLQNALRVVPVQGDLRLPTGTCTTGVTITRTSVPSTDLYVFLTTRPTTNGALAYAASCVDDQYDRAIVGYINVDPKSISTDVSDFRSQKGTILHELTHILGFSSEKFRRPLRGMDNAIPLVAGEITGPAVRSFARSYFNCGTLTGALVENNGAAGTTGSHWEKEQWMNEYMTGQSTQNPVFSALTLAFFQDSGWYYVDYSYAEIMLFGYRAGCEFAASCAGWPTGNGYKCSREEADMCTFDLQARGHCGGSDESLVSCDYIKGYSDAWCIDSTKSRSGLDSGEQYCEDCRCFRSTLAKNSPTGLTARPLCYKTACVDSNTLKVWVDSFWYDCPEGDDVAAINFGGAITCPKASLVCAQRPSNATFWPTISIISPDAGLPGTTVTISGTNFFNITRVYIAGECTDIRVLSPERLTAVLPRYENIQNPTNFLKAAANVIVVNTFGNNDLAYKAFKLEISLSEDLAKAALSWVSEHWYVVVIAGVVLLAIILICYCCNRKSSKESQNNIHLQQVQGHH